MSVSVKAPWQVALSKGFETPHDLLTFLGHERQDIVNQAEQASELFKFKVPKHFAEKMLKNTFDCPLLKQVLPVAEEMKTNHDYTLDPLQENKSISSPGIIHKYQGRVLLTLSGNCAVNCRYCFRRHFPYNENQISKKTWQHVIEYLSNNPSIHEVILSGGDPLTVSNQRLKFVIENLVSIPHVRTIRFHSRLPVVLPQRIDESFIDILHHTKLNKVLVIHANHANELCEDTRKAFEALKRAKVTLLNQSVLLNGINDNPQTLIELSHTLVNQGVLPYYLHLPDKVQGTQHFDLDHEKAKEIHKVLQQSLPGYFVPKLVKEEPGEPHKTIAS